MVGQVVEYSSNSLLLPGSCLGQKTVGMPWQQSVNYMMINAWTLVVDLCTVYQFYLSNKQNVYRELLRQCRQAEEKTLDSAYQDIQRWAKMAYPKADKTTTDSITFHWCSTEFRIELHHSAPTTLNEALRKAQQLTAIEKLESTRQGPSEPSKIAVLVPTIDSSVSVA